jgi:uncharacterized membrane protein YphA (DoxX/SURF4 family)
MKNILKMNSKFYKENFKFSKENLGIYILRFGLAIVFLYFGISQILDQSKMDLFDSG